MGKMKKKKVKGQRTRETGTGIVFYSREEFLNYSMEKFLNILGGISEEDI